MLISEKRITLKTGVALSLRSPQAGDAARLLKFLRFSFRDSYQFMNSSAAYFDSMSVEDEAEVLEEFRTADDRAMMSAFEGPRIVGNLGIFGKDGEFTRHNAVIGMNMHPDFRGKGLGFEMLSYAKTAAKKFGFHRLELSVRTFNPAGIRLYEKSGFERIGLLKEVAFIDGKYCDEYLYQLIL